MLGIGGGVLITPILVNLFGIPIKDAIGASIISVISTSSGAGSVYLSRGLIHTRLAMILEIATTLGAFAGGLTAMILAPKALAIIFGAVLLYVAFMMAFGKEYRTDSNSTTLLNFEYQDPSDDSSHSFGVRNLTAGMVLSFIAGNISGLLGIGGGVVKVPIMNLVMGIPMRVSIATSNFMIGITAAASAVIYYQHGYLKPGVVTPTMLGVLLGSQIGARLGGKIQSVRLKQIFSVLLLFFSITMFFQSFGY